MPPSKKKAAGGSRSAKPGADIVGRFLGVPTNFFGVEIEGARYLAKVSSTHASRPEHVWMKFKMDGKEVNVPHHVARQWLITDAEADDPSADWYEDPVSSSDDEVEFGDGGAGPSGTGPSGARAPAQKKATAEADRPRGSVKAGR